MVVDHIGQFFYPEYVWFRVFGRFCVPMWFFLIGYAKTRKVQPEIWIGGVVLVLSSFIAGQYIFPVTILFTLGFCRLLIDPVMRRALQSYETLFGMLLLVFFLGIPTFPLVEYGTLGLMFVMLGYLARNRENITVGLPARLLFWICCFAAFTLSQILLMTELTQIHIMVLWAGMAVVAVILYFFRPQTYKISGTVLSVSRPVFHLLGRRTLYVYVLHLLLFRAVAMWINPVQYGFMEWQWMPQPLLRLFTFG